MLLSVKKSTGWGFIIFSVDFPTVRSMLLKRDLAALETALHLLIIHFSSEGANTDEQLTTKFLLKPRC